MPGSTLDNLQITETFYGWYNKTNEIIDLLNSLVGDGISGATLDDGNLIITLIDGTTLDAGYVMGSTGTSFVDASVIDGYLILGLDSGASVTAGYVQGPTGQTGARGETGDTGDPGTTGPTGEGVPPGGFAGYALVKTSDVSYETEWADVSSVARSHPGKIGGYEGGTGSLIFGRGLSQDGRLLFPRWSTNYYISQVHQGPGIAMAGATGLYPVAGLMTGFTSGYDDGLTAGIKVLNFLENTLPFEGNVYTDANSDCLGQTLDGPPGYYWNRMKYFPTCKLQPFYVGNYCYIDKYLTYIAGYENNIPDARTDRRGMYAWFGVIPANSFPTGTPQSEVVQFDGFVEGSTCAYFFRDSGVGLCGNGFAVSVTDEDFDVTGITTCAWTGDYVREVTPGRTGPISLYPEASGPLGLGNGFVLQPGWYYLMSEFIPTAWFSVGSALDTIGSTLAYEKGRSGDQVLFTHTNAANNFGDMSLFGLNGFELAPENEVTGVGSPFTPSAYLGISSIRQSMKTIPTGLSPYLWFTQGLSGGGVARFGTGDSGNYLKGHIGLHPIHESVDQSGAITIRPQTPEQASAPRIGISIKSASTQRDSLRNIDLGTNPADAANFCTYEWDGLVGWGGTYEGIQGTPDNIKCDECFGGTAGGPRPFDWHRVIFGGFGSNDTDSYYSSVNGLITYKIQLSCETGLCPTFCAPPGFPVTGALSPAPQDLVYVSEFDQTTEVMTNWTNPSFGGSTNGDNNLVYPNGDPLIIFENCNNDDGTIYDCTQTLGGVEYVFVPDVNQPAEFGDFKYYPRGANRGNLQGFNQDGGYSCDSHYPGSSMNPFGLTTAGATANPDQGWIMIFDDSGNTYFFGFYNGETGAEGSGIVNGSPVGATSGCFDCYKEHTGTMGSFDGSFSSCGNLESLPPGSDIDPGEFGGQGGGPASISTYVNAQESIHVAWYGNFPGTEKNHLIKYTSTFGCTSGTEYPEYQGP